MTRLRPYVLSLAALLSGCDGCHDDVFLHQDGGNSDASTQDLSGALDGGGDLAAFVALPDLRFKWVGAFPSYAPACATVSGAVVDECPALGSQPSVIAFGPVRLADNDAARALADAGAPAWTVRAFGPSDGNGPIAPVTSTANGEAVTAAFADLSTAISSGQIISSFDRNDSGGIGFTTMGPANDTAAYTLHAKWTGSRGGLDSFALEEGTSGRVVTAVGCDGDLADTADSITAFSFTHTGDTTGMYDTQVFDATFAQLGDAFTQLAQAGYTMTAIGRIDRNDYVLVGTRVPGQTTPRQFLVSTAATGTEDPTANLAAGYAIVGWAIDSSDYATTTTLYQK